MGGGGGPLGPAAINRPTVQAQGDYDDGEIGGIVIDRVNRSTRRKPASMPLCPSQTLHSYVDANPRRRGGKPASYGTTFHGLLQG
jgi:hypothetical protein